MRQTLWRFGNEATGQSAFLQDTDSRLTLFGISYFFNQFFFSLFVLVQSLMEGNYYSKVGFILLGSRWIAMMAE